MIFTELNPTSEMNLWYFSKDLLCILTKDITRFVMKNKMHTTFDGKYQVCELMKAIYSQ